MTTLTKYDAARAALSAARSFDEVIGIKDKFAAYAEAARRAKDSDMEDWCREIRTRAERLAGELLADLEKNKGAAATRSQAATASPTLKEIGVSKSDSSRWQALAKVPEKKFEAEIAAGHVTRAKIMRAVSPPAPKVEKKPDIKPPAPVSEVDRLKRELVEANRRTDNLDKSLQTYVEICESDDNLKESMAEIKKLKELNRILEERNNGLMAEKVELVKAVNYWKRQAEKSK